MTMAASGAAAGALGKATGQSPGSAGVRLGIAILCFLAAGLCFFIAFGSGALDFPDTWQRGQGGKVLRQGLRTMVRRASADTAEASHA